MKITEFLEKFLPNYHKRDDVARLNDLYKFLDLEMTDEEVREKGFVQNCYDDVYFEFSELQDKLFAEALQNFMNKICEKQRGNCCDAWDYFDPDDTEHSDCGDAILNAEQPKIDEI